MYKISETQCIYLLTLGCVNEQKVKEIWYGVMCENRAKDTETTSLLSDISLMIISYVLLPTQMQTLLMLITLIHSQPYTNRQLPTRRPLSPRYGQADVCAYIEAIRWTIKRDGGISTTTVCVSFDLCRYFKLKPSRVDVNWWMNMNQEILEFFTGLRNAN